MRIFPKYCKIWKISEYKNSDFFRNFVKFTEIYRNASIRNWPKFNEISQNLPKLTEISRIMCNPNWLDALDPGKHWLYPLDLGSGSQLKGSTLDPKLVEETPTGRPIIHGLVFLVPCKKWLVQCTLVQKRTLDKSLYTTYQKTRSCLSGRDVPGYGDAICKFLKVTVIPHPKQQKHQKHQHQRS